MLQIYDSEWNNKSQLILGVEFQGWVLVPAQVYPKEYIDIFQQSLFNPLW